MCYRGQLIGRAHPPIFAAARWLLANGKADPGDRVEAYRGDTLCGSGKAGELAKWTVRENDHGNPSMQLVRWKPFPSTRTRPKTGISEISNVGHVQPELADSSP
jgi:hypothetical protein